MEEGIGHESRKVLILREYRPTHIVRTQFKGWSGWRWQRGWVCGKTLHLELCVLPLMTSGIVRN